MDQKISKEQLQQELENLVDLFSHSGWKVILKDLESQLNHKIGNASDECKTNDEWQYRRGYIDALRYAYSYEYMVENQLKEMNEDTGVTSGNILED